MIPKFGKVNIKTPQNTAGSPSISKGRSGMPSPSAGKIVGGLKKNPAPGAAAQPSKSGTKIAPVIQRGTRGSK